MASPLRLSYDETSDTVVVASMSVDAVLTSGVQQATSLLTVFNATTRQQCVQRTLETARGVVHPEGLYSAAGLILTGGFNTQVRLPHPCGWVDH